MTNLSGTWLGSYWQNGEQIRFEFALIHSGNSISGNILDDSYLGEANIRGEVIGRQIQFSKRYISVRQPSINYNGTIAEDGDSMSGDWSFTNSVLGHRFQGSGPWEAHRNGDNLSLELKNVTSRLAGAKV
ncbi:MAG: hypothetical protein HC851_23620 [Acaryochloris sp. RU_4_1]|nr:hypothetical protein [Acaryochloris sp. RU_4_1]